MKEPQGDGFVQQIRKQGEEDHRPHLGWPSQWGMVGPTSSQEVIEHEAQPRMTEHEHELLFPSDPPTWGSAVDPFTLAQPHTMSIATKAWMKTRGDLPRRGFLRLFLGAIGFGAWGLHAFSPRAMAATKQDGSPPMALEGSVGMVLEYKASCSLLEDFASGQFWIQRVRASNKYLVVMQTRLHGVVGVLALQRTDLLASLVEWVPGKRRFVPLWHGDQVARQGSWRRKVLVFERGGQAYTEHRLGPDGSRQRRADGKGRVLDDPLSAFLNWRAGAYGPLKPGQGFLIDNLARREPLSVRLTVASEDEARRRRPPQRTEWQFLLTALLDKEVAESVQGSLEGWLDAQWVPVFAVAKNVRFMGEVWARLSGKWKLLEPERAQAPEPPLEPGRWSL